MHSLKHLFLLELSITHDYSSATPNSQEFLDHIEGDVANELDFRESGDHSISLSEPEVNSVSSDLVEGLSSDRVRSRDSLSAEVNQPMIILKHNPSPAFQNKYRPRVVNRRSRQIQPPQWFLVNDILYFD